MIREVTRARGRACMTGPARERGAEARREAALPISRAGHQAHGSRGRVVAGLWPPFSSLNRAIKF